MDTGQKKRCDSSDKVATQASSSPQEVEMEESVRVALAQPLLLEMILDYAMRDKGGKLCPENIQILRLVDKSWKEAVCKKLLDNKEPIFRLKLDKNNSLVESQFVGDNGKLLDTFVDYWTVGKGMPTFRIQLEADYFRLENYDSLLNCLRKCEKGLVEIEMNVPENCGSLPGILSNVALPILTKLTINFTGNRLENGREDEMDLDHSSNITLLFQSLLTKNNSLRELVLASDNWDNLHSFPGAQYATLPSTLTSTQIDFRGAEKILEILTRNHLPNLYSLDLGVTSGNTVSTLLLYQIFENTRKTLRYLTLGGEDYSGPPRVSTLLRFPVMETLKKLAIHRVHFELEREIPSMENLFPKLKGLLLYDQTPEMLQTWTSGSACTSVEKLALELVDESKPSSPSNTLPLSLEAMQSAHLKFPNVINLNVQICGRDSSGLKYIFMEMRQLTTLVITVTDAASVVSSDHWDSLLIGAPVSFVVGMGACPEYWNQVELKNDRPSIRMLEELTCLTLEEDDIDEEDQDDNAEKPLISELAFIYGFLKMPKLIDLNFNGRFRASKDMDKEWKKTTARKIIYSGSE